MKPVLLALLCLPLTQCATPPDDVTPGMRKVWNTPPTEEEAARNLEWFRQTYYDAELTRMLNEWKDAR